MTTSDDARLAAEEAAKAAAAAEEAAEAARKKADELAKARRGAAGGGHRGGRARRADEPEPVAVESVPAAASLSRRLRSRDEAASDIVETRQGRIRLRGPRPRDRRAGRRRRGARGTGAHPAGHAQPARAGGRRDRYRQDEDAAGARRAARRAGRAGVRRRHQGRPVGHRVARRLERQARRALREHRPGVAADRDAHRVLHARRSRHGRPDPRVRRHVRTAAALEGARAQRDTGVVAEPGVPLRAGGEPAAHRPRRPPVGAHLPHRHGQARAEEARRTVGLHRGRHPA